MSDLYFPFSSKIYFLTEDDTNLVIKEHYNIEETSTQISASADGGPRYRVCAC